MGVDVAVAQGFAGAVLKVDQLSGFEAVERRGGNVDLITEYPHMAGADAAVFVFLEAQGGEVHGGVLFVFMEWGGKLREILAGGQFRVSLGEAEGPTDQRRDDQSEDRDRDEIFHDASCEY